VDTAIGRLEAGLKARGIVANIVVVADHGMAATSDERRLFIDDLVAKDTYRTLDLGPIGNDLSQPRPRGGGRQGAGGRAPAPAVLAEEGYPGAFPLRHNTRVAPIFCLPETGWLLTTHSGRPKEGVSGDHGTTT